MATVSANSALALAELRHIKAQTCKTQCGLLMLSNTGLFHSRHTHTGTSRPSVGLMAGIRYYGTGSAATQCRTVSLLMHPFPGTYFFLFHQEKTNFFFTNEKIHL